MEKNIIPDEIEQIAIKYCNDNYRGSSAYSKLHACFVAGYKAAMQEYAQQSGGYSREDIKNGLIASWDACEQYINVLMSQHKTKFVNKDTFIKNYLLSLTTKQ